MRNVSPINVDSLNLTRAGLLVGAHLETAAIAPVHAVPTPMAASPVDVAATEAATAIHTKMTALHGELAPTGPEMQAKSAASASALQEQDAQNASPLKDLASAIPTSGGSSGGGTSGGSGAKTMGGSSGQGKMQAVDHTFKLDPLISNPKEPDKPNPIVGPPPPQPVPDTSKKSGERQVLDGMLEVVGGTLLDLGSAAALVPEIAAEVPTGGLDTPLTAASIGGLLTGTGMVEDGLDDLNHLGGLAK